MFKLSILHVIFTSLIVGIESFQFYNSENDYINPNMWKSKRIQNYYENVLRITDDSTTTK